jgi:hypothetical protein
MSARCSISLNAAARLVSNCSARQVCKHPGTQQSRTKSGMLSEQIAAAAHAGAPTSYVS